MFGVAMETMETLLAVDPVCCMSVSRESAAANVEHAGQTYYFCGQSCAAKFKTDPDRYGQSAQASQPHKALTGSASSSVTLRANASMAPASLNEYVRPMHPEVVRSEPGSCPICGMALEPRTTSAEEEQTPNSTTCGADSGWGPH